MDFFFAQYFLAAIIAVVGNVLLWGVVIYVAVRFIRSTGARTLSGQGGGSGDLMDTEAGAIAAGEGFDLNDNR